MLGSGHLVEVNWLTGKALTSMRDNASAAGLFVPFTCLMSLVNWEM